MAVKINTTRLAPTLPVTIAGCSEGCLQLHALPLEVYCWHFSSSQNMAYCRECINWALVIFKGWSVWNSGTLKASCVSHTSSYIHTLYVKSACLWFSSSKMHCWVNSVCVCVHTVLSQATLGLGWCAIKSWNTDITVQPLPLPSPLLSRDHLCSFLCV